MCILFVSSWIPENGESFIKFTCVELKIVNFKKAFDEFQPLGYKSPYLLYKFLSEDLSNLAPIRTCFPSPPYFLPSNIKCVQHKRVAFEMFYTRIPFHKELFTKRQKFPLHHLLASPYIAFCRVQTTGSGKYKLCEKVCYYGIGIIHSFEDNSVINTDHGA